MPASITSSDVSAGSLRSTLFTGTSAWVFSAGFSALAAVREHCARFHPLLAFGVLVARLVQLAVLVAAPLDTAPALYAALWIPSLGHSTALAVLLVAAALAVAVGASFVRLVLASVREKQLHGAAKAISAWGLFLVPVAFPPLFSLALRFVDCDYADTRNLRQFESVGCWSPTNAIAAVASILLIAVLLCLRAVSVLGTHALSRHESFFATLTPRAAMGEALIHMVMVPAVSVASPVVAQALGATLGLIGLGMALLSLPFYRRSANAVVSLTLGGGAGAALGALLLGKPGTIGLSVGLALFGALAAEVRARLLIASAPSHERILELLADAESSAGDGTVSFRSPWHAELIARLVYGSGNTEHGLALRLLGLHLYPFSPLVGLALLETLMSQRKQQLAKTIATDLNRTYTIDFKFVLFCLELARQAVDQSSDASDQAVMLRQITKQMRFHRATQALFWRAVLRDRQNVESAGFVSQMRLSEDRADALYSRLLAQWPDSSVVYRHRAVYCETVLHDHAAAKRALAKAEDLEASGGSRSRNRLLFDALLRPSKHVAPQHTVSIDIQPSQAPPRRPMVGFASAAEVYAPESEMGSWKEPVSESAPVESIYKDHSERPTNQGSAPRNITQAAVRQRASTVLFSRLRWVTLVAMALVFASVAASFFLTSSLITDFQFLALLVNRAGGSRNLVHAMARQSRAAAYAFENGHVDSQAAALTQLSGVTSALDGFLDDIHPEVYSDEIDRAWNEPSVAVLRAPNEGAPIRQTLPLIDATRSMVLESESFQSDLDGDGLFYMTENGPTVVLDGLLQLVRAYARAAQRDSSDLEDTIGLLMIILVSTMAAFVLFLFVPAVWSLRRERKVLFELLAALPKAAVAGAMEKAATSTHHADTLSSDGDDEESGPSTSSAWRSARRSARLTSDAHKRMIWILVLCWVLTLSFALAMCAVALDFGQQTGYIGHEVDYAGQRRYLSQRSVFMMQEIAVNGSTTFSDDLGDLLENAVNNLEARHNSLLYGDPGVGIPASLFRFGELTRLYEDSDCSAAFSGCAGLNEALIFFTESLLRFRSLPPPLQTTNATSFQDAMRTHDAVMQPQFDLAVQLYVKDARNLVGWYQVALSILFVLSVPAILVSLLLSRWIIRVAEEEHASTALMMLHVPRPVLESVKAIQAYLFEDDHSHESIAALLQEAEAKTKSVLEGAAVAIVLLDKRDSIQYLNDAAGEMFGWEREDAIEQSAMVLVPDGIVRDFLDPAATLHSAAFHSGMEQTVRHGVGLRRNGEQFPISLSISKGGVGGGEFVVAFIRDLTEQHETESMLRDAKAKAESVAMSLFPKQIATRLLQGESAIAEHYPSVSIMFCDLVNFTALSSHLAAPELLLLLGGIFSIWDNLIDRYRLEKIKSLGDAIMVGSGFPRKDPEHAMRMCTFAVELMSAMESYNQRTQRAIQVRIGIASGPIIAGLIGSSRVSYDVWGDTVNTSARLEGAGLAGRIHISAETKAAIEDKFETEHRGKIELKGKGEVDTYFLGTLRPNVSMDLAQLAETSEIGLYTSGLFDGAGVGSTPRNLSTRRKTVTNTLGDMLQLTQAAHQNKAPAEEPRKHSLAAARSPSEELLDEIEGEVSNAGADTGEVREVSGDAAV